jgi:hypothetical protein
VQVSVLIDRFKQTTTEGHYRQAGHNPQRYVTEHVPYQSVTTIPLIQAAHAAVKGYAYADRSCTETTWLGEP